MSEWIVSSEDLGCDGSYFSYCEVIRCSNCRWFTDRTKAIGTGSHGEVIEYCVCIMNNQIMPENGYCSKARWRDENND